MDKILAHKEKYKGKVYQFSSRKVASTFHISNNKAIEQVIPKILIAKNYLQLNQKRNSI